jgi:two-component system, NarL family, sensor kinase
MLFATKIKGQHNDSINSILNSKHQWILNRLENDPKSALKEARRCQLISKYSTSAAAKSQALIDLAFSYLHFNQFDSALKYSYRGLRQTTQVDDSITSRAFACIGEIYFKKAESDSAIYYQQKSLRIREKSGRKPEIINSLYSLGAISNSVGDSAQARRYFSECLNQAEEYRDIRLMARATEGMASMYYANNSLEKAIYLYNRAGRLYSDGGNESGEALCLLNTGSVYDELGRFPESLRAYEMALQIFQKSGSKEKILLCYSNMGAVYAGNNQLDKALQFHRKAMTLAENLNAVYALSDIYLNVSDCFKAKQSMDSALFYFEMHVQLKDSLLGLEKIKNINELQEKYNKEKRESEIATLKEMDELNRKRGMLLIALSTLLACLLMLTFIIFRQRARNAKVVAEKNEQLYRKKINEIIKEQELKSISSIMEGQESERKRIAEDLHDRLGSMLATIKLHFNAIESKMEHIELKSLEQYNRANKLLDEVCDEVRKIAHNMESGVLVNFGLAHAITDLKEALEHTSDLRIQVNTFGMNRRLGMDIEINLYRIIQELLSNVIRHSGAKEVNIDLNCGAEQLTVMVSDNGRGYDPQVQKDKQGMGLRNIQSRVSKLTGKYFVDSGMGNGTTVIIEIPLPDDQTAHS